MQKKNNKKYTSLDEAIKITKKAGFVLNFPAKQTLAEDLFELKKDINKAKNQISAIHWIMSVFVIALLVAMFLILADYAQFATKAYNQFEQQCKIENQEKK